MSESETEPETEPEPEEEQVDAEDIADQDIEEAIREQMPEEIEAHDGEKLDPMSLLGEGGIRRMLLQETYYDPETDFSYSQADIIADVVNVMRMDAKQMAALHGIDVKAEKMSPERAATLVEEMAKGDDLGGLISVFQKIEEKMDQVFIQEMTEEQYAKYQQFKEGMLYVNPEGGE